MNKFTRFILVVVATLAMLFFGSLMKAKAVSTVNTEKSPLGVASKFKYFATGNVDLGNNGSSINSRIAANTLTLSSTWWGISGNPTFESTLLKDPVLVLNSIDSNNTSLIRAIGQDNDMAAGLNSYVADSIPSLDSIPIDGNYLTTGYVTNFENRRKNESVSDETSFQSLGTSSNPFQSAAEQLKQISAMYATGNSTSVDAVSSEGTNDYDITLKKNYTNTPIIFLSPAWDTNGPVKINFKNLDSNNLPYIILNWNGNNSDLTWGNWNNQSLSITNSDKDSSVSYSSSRVINNFINTNNLSISAKGFIGAIFAPNTAISITNSGGNNADNITNIVGSSINSFTSFATNNNIVDSDNFPGTQGDIPSISGVSFTNGTTTVDATSDTTSSIPVNNSNDTTINVSTSTSLPDGYGIFVQINNGSWQSFTNGQTISDLTGYNKTLASSSANSSNSVATTVGFNLARTNTLKFAIADNVNDASSSTSTFTTTLNETGALTATLPSVTAIGNVALGSKSGTTSGEQNITFTNTWNLANVILSVSLGKNLASGFFYDPSAIKIQLGSSSSLTGFDPLSSSDTLSSQPVTVSDNTASTTFALNVALGNSSTTMKEVTPGSSYTIPLYWSINYSGDDS